MAVGDNSFELASGRLRELRGLSGYSLEDTAKRMKISPESLNKIEEGSSEINMKQMRKLSSIYKRPLAAFFSEATPEPIHKISDHRINREKKEVPEIYVAERRAYYVANKMIQLSDKRSKIPTFRDNLNADKKDYGFLDDQHQGLARKP